MYSITYQLDGKNHETVLYNNKGTKLITANDILANLPIRHFSIDKQDVYHFSFQEPDEFGVVKFNCSVGYDNFRGTITYTDNGAQVVITEVNGSQQDNPKIMNFDQYGNLIKDKQNCDNEVTEENLASLLNLPSQIYMQFGGYQNPDYKFEATQRDAQGRITAFKMTEPDLHFTGSIVYDCDGGFKIYTSGSDLNVRNNKGYNADEFKAQVISYDNEGYRKLSESEIAENVFGVPMHNEGYSSLSFVKTTKTDESGRITEFQVTNRLFNGYIPNNLRDNVFSGAIKYLDRYINVQLIDKNGSVIYEYLLDKNGELLLSGEAISFQNIEQIEYAKQNLTNIEEEKLTGWKDDKYYIKGILASGEIDGITYVGGKLANGTYGGKIYIDGQIADGKVKGKLYNKGVIVNGLYNGLMYKDGELYSGTKLEKGYACTYQAGILVNKVFLD